MVDRQSLVARVVAETRRWLAPPFLARIPDTRSNGRRPRLGLSHPRIDEQLPISHLADAILDCLGLSAGPVSGPGDDTNRVLPGP